VRYVLLAAFAACTTALPPAELPEGDYPDGGIVEVYRDGSPQAVASPCGQACASLQRLGCPETAPRGSITCYIACTKAASLRTIPVACWARATSQAEARACGGLRCIP